MPCQTPYPLPVHTAHTAHTPANTPAPPKYAWIGGDLPPKGSSAAVGTFAFGNVTVHVAVPEHSRRARATLASEDWPTHKGLVDKLLFTVRTLFGIEGGAAWTLSEEDTEAAIMAARSSTKNADAATSAEGIAPGAPGGAAAARPSSAQPSAAAGEPLATRAGSPAADRACAPVRHTARTTVSDKAVNAPSPVPPPAAPRYAYVSPLSAGGPAHPLGIFMFRDRLVRVEILEDGRARATLAQPPVPGMAGRMERLRFMLRTLFGLEGGAAWKLSRSVTDELCRAAHWAQRQAGTASYAQGLAVAGLHRRAADATTLAAIRAITCEIPPADRPDSMPPLQVSEVLCKLIARLDVLPAQDRNEAVDVLLAAAPKAGYNRTLVLGELGRRIGKASGQTDVRTQLGAFHAAMAGTENAEYIGPLLPLLREHARAEKEQDVAPLMDMVGDALGPRSGAEREATPAMAVAWAQQQGQKTVPTGTALRALLDYARDRSVMAVRRGDMLSALYPATRSESEALFRELCEAALCLAEVEETAIPQLNDICLSYGDEASTAMKTRLAQIVARITGSARHALVQDCLSRVDAPAWMHSFVLNLLLAQRPAPEQRAQTILSLARWSVARMRSEPGYASHGEIPKSFAAFIENAQHTLTPAMRIELIRCGHAWIDAGMAAGDRVAMAAGKRLLVAGWPTLDSLRRQMEARDQARHRGDGRLHSKLSAQLRDVRKMFKALMAGDETPPLTHACHVVRAIQTARQIFAPAERAVMFKRLIALEARVARRPAGAHFDATRRALWHAIRGLPDQYQQALFGDLATWFVQKPSNPEQAERWRKARGEFTALWQQDKGVWRLDPANAGPANGDMREVGAAAAPASRALAGPHAAALSLLDLPNEILEAIASHLSAIEVIDLSQRINHAMRDRMGHPRAYRAALTRCRHVFRLSQLESVLAGAVVQDAGTEVVAYRYSTEQQVALIEILAARLRAFHKSEREPGLLRLLAFATRGDPDERYALAVATLVHGVRREEDLLSADAVRALCGAISRLPLSMALLPWFKCMPGPRRLKQQALSSLLAGPDGWHALLAALVDRDDLAPALSSLMWAMHESMPGALAKHWESMREATERLPVEAQAVRGAALRALAMWAPKAVVVNAAGPAWGWLLGQTELLSGAARFEAARALVGFLQIRLDKLRRLGAHAVEDLEAAASPVGMSRGQLRGMLDWIGEAQFTALDRLQLEAAAIKLLPPTERLERWHDAWESCRAEGLQCSDAGLALIETLGATPVTFMQGAVDGWGPVVHAVEQDQATSHRFRCEVLCHAYGYARETNAWPHTRAAIANAALTMAEMAGDPEPVVDLEHSWDSAQRIRLRGLVSEAPLDKQVRLAARKEFQPFFGERYIGHALELVVRSDVEAGERAKLVLRTAREMAGIIGNGSYFVDVESALQEVTTLAEAASRIDAEEALSALAVLARLGDELTLIAGVMRNAKFEMPERYAMAPRVVSATWDIIARLPPLARREVLSRLLGLMQGERWAIQGCAMALWSSNVLQAAANVARLHMPGREEIIAGLATAETMDENRAFGPTRRMIWAQLVAPLPPSERQWVLLACDSWFAPNASIAPELAADWEEAKAQYDALKVRADVGASRVAVVGHEAGQASHA